MPVHNRRPMAHRIVIVGFPPAQLLDIAGPLDVFAGANLLAAMAGRPPAYEVRLAAPQPGPLATTAGVPLLASHGLHGRGLRADTLLIAGGPGARAMVGDAPLVQALKRLCGRTARVGSICTGAFPLAATGALDGCRATTHWAHFDEFAALFPQVQIDRDALFVADGRHHTSAGITAGIDYALALVERDLGRREALEVARGLVMFLKRPGGQSQFSTQLAAQAEAPGGAERFAELARWMAANLKRDLGVERLAERMAMSPRNFARRFAEAMQVTPARYVQQLRIDAARHLLTDGQQPVARIAERCGFASAEAMRVAFQRHLKVAPAAFRARFRGASRR